MNDVKITIGGQEFTGWEDIEIIRSMEAMSGAFNISSARRLRTIFDTNLRTAHSAGQWERIQRVKKTRPYLRYVALIDSRTRDQHRAWHDIILPVDHPFWQKFYPPNGWGCRCSVQQLSDRDLKRLGLEVTRTDPSTPDRTVRDIRNGRILKVPQGIAPGFDFNPGMARMRALTPPVLNKPLNVPYQGYASEVPLPPVRTLEKSAIYPDGLEDTAYLNRFLKEFDAKPDKPVIFKDVTGEPVIISDELFKTATGRLKISKDMRFRYLGLLAKTVRDPDEIWLQWEEYPKGRWTLRRKYIARYDVEGEAAQAFVLFDTNEKGWSGVTTFPPKKEKYLERQRAGSLVYRRPDSIE